MTDSGVIYCPSLSSSYRGILKIDTNTDNVTELNFNFLPENGRGLSVMWASCAAAMHLLHAGSCRPHHEDRSQ